MHSNWVKTLNEFGKRREACFFVVNFEATHGNVFRIKDLTKENILLNFPNFKSECAVQKYNKGIQFRKEAIDFKIYAKAFDKAVWHLKRGDTYLLNLTFPTAVDFNLSLQEIFAQAQAKYKICFQDKWLCFSPETFVQIQGKAIQTFPMKGTIDAKTYDAANILLNDRKEMAEHSTIVDLLRNDLSLVANNVTVKQFMYLDKIKTHQGEIFQMSSKIVGEIQEDWHAQLGIILKKLLPAGSICGAPKAKTVEIIKAVENYERNFYSGIAGYYDGDSLDTCVLIRFIERIDNKYIYKSGGGITAMSNLEKEYAELNQKVYVPIH